MQQPELIPNSINLILIAWIHYTKYHKSLLLQRIKIITAIIDFLIGSIFHNRFMLIDFKLWERPHPDKTVPICKVYPQNDQIFNLRLPSRQKHGSFVSVLLHVYTANKGPLVTDDFWLHLYSILYNPVESVDSF